MIQLYHFMDTLGHTLLRRLAAVWRAVVARRNSAVATPPPGPRVLPAYAALARYRVGTTHLEPRLHLLVTQLAAERSGCRWCIERGRHAWREAHLPMALLRALRQYETSDAFFARERAALRLADAVAGYADADDRRPLEALTHARRHFSEPEIAALTAAVAAVHFFNPITGELGADAELREGARPSWGAPVGSALRSFWL
jgi:alkylhydroperoxidase family enzyme